MLRVNGHSVLAIGLKNSTVKGNVQPTDILIVDPGDGKIKNADEIYKGWSNNTQYLPMVNNTGWSLRIPK